MIAAAMAGFKVGCITGEVPQLFVRLPCALEEGNWSLVKKIV